MTKKVNAMYKFPALHTEKNFTADEMSSEEMQKIMDMAEKEFKEAISEARSVLSDDLVYFVRKQPFFASIAVDLKKVVTIEVPYAAVNIINTISHLYINPYTYPVLPKRERIAILIHEVLHLALGHIFRYLELPDDEKNHYWWNLATDCAINQLVPNTPDIGLPDWVYFPETFKKYGFEMPPNLSAEEYYEILKQNQEKLPPDLNSGGGEGGQGNKGDGSQSDGQSGGGAQGKPNGDSNNQAGDGKDGVGGGSGDDQGVEDGQNSGSKKHQNWHAKWGETEGNKKLNEAAVKKAVKQAYMRSAGNIPGNIKPLIEQMLESKIDWRSRFRQYSAKYLRYFKVSTFKKESRRLGELAKGRRKGNKLKVAVFVDTSASVSDENLKQFTGEIVKIHRANVHITVMEVDTQVYDVYEFKGHIKRLEYKGRGGTSLIVPFEKLQKDRMEVDLVIYLTDGEGMAPDKFNIPTLWVLTPGGSRPYDSTNNPVKWGHVIEINK